MSEKVFYKINGCKTIIIEVESRSDVELVKELNRDTDRITKADKSFRRRYISLDKLSDASFGEPQDSMLTPEEELLEKESREELQALVQMAMHGLTERQRELIHLRYWENKKLREIAEEKGVSIASIGEGLNSAIKKIKKNLENFGKTP